MAEWWQTGVIYQIYPRSFMDGNGDGIGDLSGIAARLDHLVDLGVDAVWISPFYPSPMKDFGYDVSDYVGVDPIFGTLDDFERLRDAVHGRGLKLILDLVPGHCSDRHPWFQEARASRDAEKRDWFVWADPGPDGGPPNNWISEFAGPAWTRDPGTGQYYLHIFLPEQPSLNWHNPAVAEAMHAVMQTWFDRGVDGFRVDAVENMGADPLLRDNPANPDWLEAMGPARSLLGQHTKHQPILTEITRDMRSVAARQSPERLLIGEIYGTIEELMPYYGAKGDGFHMPFNFALIETPWDAAAIAGVIRRYEDALPEGAWPNWVLGNHDRARIASRAGRGQARAAAMLLLTLRGTPTIYQGDELGMENAPIPPEAVHDPWEINVPGQGLGRDPVRTPIPWEAGPNAGFTSDGAVPWLPIAVPPGGSVAEQAGDPGSMLALTRALLRLRRETPALRTGSIAEVRAEGGCLHYLRTDAGGTQVHVALNLGDRPCPCPGTGRLLLHTDQRETGGAAPDTLAPGDGVILAPA